MIAGHPNFGARCILNLFYHECGGEQWQIAAPSRNNSIALSGNHSESIGHHGPASRGTHAAASSSLSSLLPLFSLDGPPGHHRRTPSNSSVSSASSEDSFYEEPTLVDINENLGTCNDGSSGRVARGDSSASDVDISKPGGSRNISAPMLRDITTNPSQVTKRTMSAPAPHRTSSSLRRAPMSRTFSFSPNLKRHFLARSLSNPRTHVRIVRACVVVCCNSWHDVNITCRALLTSQCVCCGIVTAGRPSRRMAYCDSCRRMAWCFCQGPAQRNSTSTPMRMWRELAIRLKQYDNHM